MNRPASPPAWLDRTAVAIIILSAPVAAYLWVTLP